MRPRARLWETFAVVAALGIASGVCLAAEEAQESEKLPQVSGEIASVDTLEGIVTLKESTNPDPTIVPTAQPTNFLVDAKTVISKDQQPLTLADVRVGDTVTIEYATNDGNNVASSITIQLPTATSSGSADSTTAEPSTALY